MNTKFNEQTLDLELNLFFTFYRHLKTYCFGKFSKRVGDLLRETIYLSYFVG